MLNRLIFAIKEGFERKKALKALPFVMNILSINWLALHDSGIRVIVLDFDGVLAADKKQALHPGVDAVLLEILKIFGQHVYIYSNQPTSQRHAYFSEYFPEIKFLVAKQKPYPDGLLSVIVREQIDPYQIMLIDDRVLTGGLAAVLAGTQCLLVKKPFICFYHNTVREIAFMTIRWVERILFH